MKILKNEKIILDGMGSSKRSFVHIKDITEGYYKILKKVELDIHIIYQAKILLL